MPQKYISIGHVIFAEPSPKRVRLKPIKKVHQKGGTVSYRSGKWGEKDISVASFESMRRDGRIVDLSQVARLGPKEGLFRELNQDIIVSTGLDGPVLRVVGRMPIVPSARHTRSPLEVETGQPDPAPPCVASQGLGTPRTRFGDPLFGG